MSSTADAEPRAPHSIQPGCESIDDGVRILKHGETFAVFDRHGDAALGRSSHGLYHEGTRHLSLFALDLGSDRPVLLKSTLSRDNVLLTVDLTNPVLGDESGIDADTVHILRSVFLSDGVLHEEIHLTNHGMIAVSFTLMVRFDADFADVFEVRGTRRNRRGKRLSPDISLDRVRLSYRGLDGVVRRTELVATPPPAQATPHEMRFELKLAPKEETAIQLRVLCECAGESLPRRPSTRSFDEELTRRHEERIAHCGRVARVRSSNEAFNQWLERSVADVAMLVTATEHGSYPYAGTPWYSTVFGRDGILTAMSTLWVDPALARGVLRVLTATQAHERDDARDAQPGKIVHELRGGEMAALGEIPFGRYYGTVDATPLYVVLAGMYLDRTSDLETIRDIWPAIQAALGWMDATAASHPRGFLAYARTSGDGLVHQGWKDSATAVFHDDGRLAKGPIALCEVQGYAYAAKRCAARIARALLEPARAAVLDQEAEQLRIAFEEAFWLEDLGTYAFAVCGEGHPCRVRTSNAGHCLWAGIASQERARRVAASLLEETMFSGWGVRTLDTREIRYNPMSYHNGSVWPHDTAIAAAGIARYGMKQEALRILTGLFDASCHMDLHRMPELICGFPREDGEGPTMYPVACSPQAWAAAAPFLLLQSCLGIAVDGRQRLVSIREPALPDWLEWVDVRNLHVGEGAVDLVIHRDAETPRVEVLLASDGVRVLTSDGRS